MVNRPLKAVYRVATLACRPVPLRASYVAQVEHYLQDDGGGVTSWLGTVLKSGTGWRRTKP